MKLIALASAISLLSGAVAQLDCCLPHQPLDTATRCLGRVYEGYTTPSWNTTYKNYGFTGAGIDQCNRFGQSVAASKNYFIVGAPFSNAKRGAVFVFHNQGNDWSQSQKIDPVYEASVSGFMGEALDICDEYRTIVIGDSRANGRSGAVHIFELDQKSGQFKMTQTIENPADKAGDRFGYSVSINKEYLVVGAFGHDNGAKNTGAAYIFSRKGSGDQFSLLQSLKESTVAGDAFGTTVAVHDKTVVVGAPGAGNGNGVARIYWREQSQNQFELKDTKTGSTKQNLGGVVEVNTKTVLVSGGGNAGAGEVLLYELKESELKWELADTLTAPDGDEQDLFGSAMDINDDDIVIGAKYSGAEGACGGSVYYFHKKATNWIFKTRLAHPMDPARDNARDYFGISVALEHAEHKIIVGASGDDDKGSHAGMVDMFDIKAIHDEFKI